MVLMQYNITLRRERKKKKYDHLWIQVKILRYVYVAQMKDRVEKHCQNPGDSEGWNSDGSLLTT